MLRARLISAAILVPLVVFGVLAADTRLFGLLFGLVIVAASWEWSALVPLVSVAARLSFSALIAGCLVLADQLGPAAVVQPVLVVALLWWVAALVWLVRPGFCALPRTGCTLLKLLAGVLVCCPPWVALVTLHGYSPQLALIVLVMVWIADSGAYFAGRAWGKTRLAPAVSPGKTREGMYGGLLASMLFALPAAWWYSGSLDWTLTFLPVALVAMLFSVAGDLLESLMKRQSGIKDSGSIIPGHGGLFDRIDSLVAAAPVFMGGYFWLGL